MASTIDPTKPADGTPAVKLDLRDNLSAAKTEIEALQTDKLENGQAISMADQLLTRPKLRDYSEASTSPGISTGALTLDLEAGNAFDVVLTENVTSISIVNAPASGDLGTIAIRFRQDATGGRTVDFSGLDFGDATVPTVPTTATTGRLWITALTLDGGTTWEAMKGFEKG